MTPQLAPSRDVGGGVRGKLVFTPFHIPERSKEKATAGQQHEFQTLQPVLTGTPLDTVCPTMVFRGVLLRLEQKKNS